MNTQINIRVPDILLRRIEHESKARGYSTIQAFILETMREEVMDLSPSEYARIAKSLGNPQVHARLGEKAAWKALRGDFRKVSGKKIESNKKEKLSAS